jgi:hypothetical protein
MKITFVQAANGTPLVKNRITGQNYPSIANVNSFEHEGEGLQWMHQLLLIHATRSSALLTGNLDKELVGESRAGHVVIASAPYMILDVDADLPYTSREDFLDNLGIKTSYIFQHSASSKTDDDLRGHYFIPLDTPTHPKTIKEWLKGMNFKLLRAELTLSNNEQSLRWPLDIIVNDPGRIVYIAPPIQASDPISHRILFIDKGNESFTLPPPEPVNIPEAINRLRGGKNLPEVPQAGSKKTITINPDEVKITGQKQNGEFTYFNLNGGDSWGYFVGLDDPSIVRNFKGEPNFRLKDLDPEVYEALRPKKPAPIGLIEGAIVELTPLVFRNPKTDVFHQVLHDANMRVHNMYTTASRQRLNDFMVTNGAEKPSEIHDWTVEFDPTRAETINRKEKWFNLYKPTDLMLITETTEACPQHIMALIKHLTVDEETYSHFMNWIAFIYQFRQKTGTAWIFHGHTGTGKGTLFTEVLRPIFGGPQTHTCTIDTALEMYNSHMERCLVMFIDEFDITDVGDSSKAFNKLKNYITEEMLNIRAMRSQQVQAKNYTNMIMGTNMSTPIKIDESDRRINLPPAQTRPLEGLQSWRDRIQDELPEFCMFLNGITVDKKAARTTLHNETRAQMINAGRTSHEDFFYALKSGDLDFFLDNFLLTQPVGYEYTYTKFETVVTAWQSNTTSVTQIPKEDLRAVYEYVIAPRSLSMLKFTAICKNNGVMFTRDVVEGKRILQTPITFIAPKSTIGVPTSESKPLNTITH